VPDAAQPPDAPGTPASVRVSLAILAATAVILLLRHAQDVLIPLVLSGLLFYALDPLVDTLARWRVPRAVGAALAVLLVVGSIGGLAYSLRDQAAAVVEELPRGAERLRGALRRARGQRDSPLAAVERAAREIDRTAAEATPSPPPPRGVMRVRIEEDFSLTDYLWWGSVGAAAFAGQVAMILFLTYFLLVADDLFKRKLVRYAGATLASRRITVQVLDEIAAQIERFLLVQVATSLLVGVVTWIVLWWLGVEQAAVWGLAAGVLNSVPYFGPILVTAGLAVVAFLQFGTPGMTAAVAGVALAITTLEGWFVTPLLIGKATRMNQVAVFVGLLFWSWMWGVWGFLLAVPIMVVVKAICDHVEGLQPVGDFLGE
jgi:predicted PurR-regulated permease PerM